MEFRRIPKSCFGLAGWVLFALVISCSSGGSSSSQGGAIPPPPPPPGPTSFQLLLVLSGLGGGQLKVNANGIDSYCTTGNCIAVFDSGTLITLTAIPDGNSLFSGWGGICSPSGISSCTFPINSAESVPVIFSTAGNVTISSISAGETHTCMMVAGTGAACFGDNAYGQLGNGENTATYAPVLVSVGSGSSIQNLSAGGYHTCALISGGTVSCWGLNTYGQLGNGSSANSNLPQTVSAITAASSASTAIAIAAGGSHTCAVMADGTATCWGLNTSGQLGDNANEDHSTVPVTVYGVTSASSATFTAISAGANHTCGLMSDGTVYCWGANNAGQLGNGSNTSSSQFVQVNGITNGKSISAGGDHTCALLADGTMQCWGDNTYGQLGNGQTNNSNTPVIVSQLTTGAIMSSGGNHSCAILSSGAENVLCWGDNLNGQLGFLNSTATYYSTPQPVSGL